MTKQGEEDTYSTWLLGRTTCSVRKGDDWYLVDSWVGRRRLYPQNEKDAMVPSFRSNGYGTTPLTPCEMKMNEAVAEYKRRCICDALAQRNYRNGC